MEREERIGNESIARPIDTRGCYKRQFFFSTCVATRLQDEARKIARCQEADLDHSLLLVLQQ